MTTMRLPTVWADKPRSIRSFIHCRTIDLVTSSGGVST